VHWVDGVAGSRFFAWLHFYDAHAPYEPPLPYRRAHEHPYDGAVAFIDAQIGQLLKILELRGLLDRTVVVVVGDHGESLGDHGESTHGLFVYESVLHVPLMIRAPRAGLRGRRMSGVTRSVDVMPTVLELLGVPYEGRTDGESLLPLIAGVRRGLHAYAENLYPQLRFGWSAVRALRAGRFKIVGTARPELYDLQHDPLERQNLFDVRRDVAAQMLARLRRHAETSADGGALDAPPVDLVLQERLGSLGYVSVATSGARPKAQLGPAPDPKDMIAVFNRLASPRGVRGRADVADQAPALSEGQP
jgi:arylsulfatase A-like enzyme